MKIVLLTADRECAKCRKAKAILARIAERFPHVQIEILRVSDPAAAPYGIVMSPTVVVDDTIIASGRPPNEEKLAAYIEANSPGTGNS